MNRREMMMLLGSAVTAPRALRAQQKAMPVIGYLDGTTPDAHVVRGRPTSAAPVCAVQRASRR